MEKADSIAPSGISLDFDVFAEEYDALTGLQYETGLALMEELGVGLGMEVLDVGCGAGRLTLEIGRKVGEQGRVMGIDIAPKRIEVAKGNAKEAALGNVDFRICQAENLNSPNSLFDIVFSNLSLHWFEDKLKALIEMKRVLKRGGRIGITTVGLKSGIEFREAEWKVLKKEKYLRYIKDYKYPITYFKPSEVAALLATAGFQDIKLGLVFGKRRYASPQALIRYREVVTGRCLVGHLPSPLNDTAWSEILAECERRLGQKPQTTREIIYALAISPG